MMYQSYGPSSRKCKSLNNSIHKNILICVMTMIKITQDMKNYKLLSLTKINNYSTTSIICFKIVWRI